MLQERTVSSQTQTDSQKRRVEVASLAGPAVARVIDTAVTTDVLLVAVDEPRAEAFGALLAAAAGDLVVIYLPTRDTLLGADSLVLPGIAGRRSAALRRLREPRQTNVVLVVSVETALDGVPELQPAFQIGVGDKIETEELIARLQQLGYWDDDRVDEPGEYALRTVFDLYPSQAQEPVRIECDGGVVTAVRCFDPLSQRTTGEIDTVLFEAAFETIDRSITVFDLLPDAVLALDVGVKQQRDRLYALISDLGDMAPPTVGLNRDTWDDVVASRQTLVLAAGEETPGTRFVERRSSSREAAAAIQTALAAKAVVVIAGHERDLRFIVRRIEKTLGHAPTRVTDWRAIAEAAPGTVFAIAMPLDRGWQQDGLLVIAAADLLGTRAGDTAEKDASNPLFAFGDFALRTGDVVIHEDHGAGILRGIETLEVEGDKHDSIRIEHDNAAMRLLPVEEADRLWRYSGDAQSIALDKLDGSSWQKRSAGIAETIAGTARELQALANERAKQSAAVIDPDGARYEQFAAGFRFTETADQAAAIAAVRDDLASGRRMDRIVLGDVGFGKTEIALRAAALVAISGRQAAIAAPTTILVRQHLETFQKRFAKFNIQVRSLSRLTPPAEAKQIKAGLADGSIHLVIGTQALVGKGVTFHDLALVVIDEEHRFGQAIKTKLRTLGRHCHTLALTATPIPRTLQTALSGLQDLSVLATPPARRQPIRTVISSMDDAVVRTALVREKSRGGQSFVVVPRIEDMAAVGQLIARLVPHLTVLQAHGKMNAGDIDTAMIAFAGGKVDILLATNIIEAGLDVPAANTMLIAHPERFGLAQLHQLRGRVGRGNRRGHILLLTLDGVKIAPQTLKRLKTLETFDQLGAGFAISAQDLDARGAGDLLGESQAGHVKLIGTDLYQHLLERALKTKGKADNDRWNPELKLGATGYLPANWLPDEDVRVSLYVRIARLESVESVDNLGDELRDRFGALPPEVELVLESAMIRCLARAAGVATIDAGPCAIAFKLRRACKKIPRITGLALDQDQLILKQPLDTPQQRRAALVAVLQALNDEISS
jgi:transcription-repair coupling factor (superfamily II helicase)